MCVCTYVCMYVYVFIYTTCMYSLREPEGGIGSPRTKVTAICAPPCGWWVWNPSICRSNSALNWWACVPSPQGFKIFLLVFLCDGLIAFSLPTWTRAQSLFKKSSYSLFMCVEGCAEVPVRRSEDDPGNSPSATRILGIKLRASGLVPSVSTCWVISLVCQGFLSYLSVLVFKDTPHSYTVFWWDCGH